MADREPCSGGEPCSETQSSGSKCCTTENPCCAGCNCSCCQTKQRDGPAECNCERGSCQCCGDCKGKATETN